MTIAQPSRSSRTRSCAASSPSSGICAGRRRARHAALTRNVAASIAIASPGPDAAISAAAMTGPPTMPMFAARPSSALASWTRAAPTVCGISPLSAGPKNASAVPKHAISATSIQICADPLSSSTAMVACVVARTRSATSITLRLPSRSESAPPGSATMRNGSAAAAVTQPRSATVPMSSTANASAT